MIALISYQAAAVVLLSALSATMAANATGNRFVSAGDAAAAIYAAGLPITNRLSWTIGTFVLGVNNNFGSPALLSKTFHEWFFAEPFPVVAREKMHLYLATPGCAAPSGLGKQAVRNAMAPSSPAPQLAPLSPRSSRAGVFSTL